MQTKSQVPFINFKLLIVLLVFHVKIASAQLPPNVNFVADFHNTTSFSGNVQGWIYDNLIVSGTIVSVGYSYGATQHPSITRVVGGTQVYEQVLSCINGVFHNIFDTPSGYVVFGEGFEATSCSPRNGYFSVLIDKGTGNLVPTWGIKFYDPINLTSIPLTGSGLPASVGRRVNGTPKFCNIKNGSGATVGYMLCCNYYTGFVSTTQNFSDGSFLLKLDQNGNPDPGFGNGGAVFYNQTTLGGSIYWNSHFSSVCVDYSGGYSSGGSPQGYVVCGYKNENPNTIQTWDENNIDAFVMKVDLTGNILWEDVYDDFTHNKTGTPYSIAYTDNPDFPSCLNSLASLTGAQENNNEFATRILQDPQSGDFIILNQFDFSYFYNYTGTCPSSFPSTGAFIFADPAVIRMQTNGTIAMITNLFQSSAVDFQNDIELIPGTNHALVLGATTTDNSTFQEAVISRFKLSNGAIVYERSYSASSSGQNMYCPFCINIDGVLCGIGGDANGLAFGTEYYETYLFQY